MPPNVPQDAELRRMSQSESGGLRWVPQVPRLWAPGRTQPLNLGAPGASLLGTWESTTTEYGCPKCLAFGHLGNLRSQPAFSRNRRYSGNWLPRRIALHCDSISTLPSAPVLSQVPKSEAPGPPIFSGCDHFSRHLGHPPERRHGQPSCDAGSHPQTKQSRPRGRPASTQLLFTWFGLRIGVRLASGRGIDSKQLLNRNREPWLFFDPLDGRCEMFLSPSTPKGRIDKGHADGLLL